MSHFIPEPHETPLCFFLFVKPCVPDFALATHALKPVVRTDVSGAAAWSVELWSHIAAQRVEPGFVPPQPCERAHHTTAWRLNHDDFRLTEDRDPCIRLRGGQQVVKLQPPSHYGCGAWFPFRQVEAPLRRSRFFMVARVLEDRLLALELWVSWKGMPDSGGEPPRTVLPPPWMMHMLHGLSTVCTWGRGGCGRVDQIAPRVAAHDSCVVEHGTGPSYRIRSGVVTNRAYDRVVSMLRGRPSKDVFWHSVTHPFLFDHEEEVIDFRLRWVETYGQGSVIDMPVLDELFTGDAIVEAARKALKCDGLPALVHHLLHVQHSRRHEENFKAIAQYPLFRQPEFCRQLFDLWLRRHKHHVHKAAPRQDGGTYELLLHLPPNQLRMDPFLKAMILGGAWYHRAATYTNAIVPTCREDQGSAAARAPSVPAKILALAEGHWISPSFDMMNHLPRPDELVVTKSLVTRVRAPSPLQAPRIPMPMNGLFVQTRPHDVFIRLSRSVLAHRNNTRLKQRMAETLAIVPSVGDELRRRAEADGRRYAGLHTLLEQVADSQTRVDTFQAILTEHVGTGHSRPSLLMVAAMTALDFKIAINTILPNAQRLMDDVQTATRVSEASAVVYTQPDAQDETCCHGCWAEEASYMANTACGHRLCVLCAVKTIKDNACAMCRAALNRLLMDGDPAQYATADVDQTQAHTVRFEVDTVVEWVRAQQMGAKRVMVFHGGASGAAEQYQTLFNQHPDIVGEWIVAPGTHRVFQAHDYISNRLDNMDQWTAIETSVRARLTNRLEQARPDVAILISPPVPELFLMVAQLKPDLRAAVQVVVMMPAGSSELELWQEYCQPTSATRSMVGSRVIPYTRITDSVISTFESSEIYNQTSHTLYSFMTDTPSTRRVMDMIVDADENETGTDDGVVTAAGNLVVTVVIGQNEEDEEEEEEEGDEDDEDDEDDEGDEDYTGDGDE